MMSIGVVEVYVAVDGRGRRGSGRGVVING